MKDYLSEFLKKAGRQAEEQPSSANSDSPQTQTTETEPTPSTGLNKPIGKTIFSGTVVDVFNMLPECQRDKKCYRFKLNCPLFPLLDLHTGKLSGRCIQRANLNLEP